MVIQSRRRAEDQCREFQREYNLDINLYSNGKITSKSICSKWSKKLERTSCRSLIKQLKTFCSENFGVN